jgi:hypothetical protein
VTKVRILEEQIILFGVSCIERLSHGMERNVYCRKGAEGPLDKHRRNAIIRMARRPEIASNTKRPRRLGNMKRM